MQPGLESAGGWMQPGLESAGEWIQPGLESARGWMQPGLKSAEGRWMDATRTRICRCAACSLGNEAEKNGKKNQSLRDTQCSALKD